MLTELDWLHAIVYTNGWDVLADELLLTVPGKAGLTHVLLLKAPWRKLIPLVTESANALMPAGFASLSPLDEAGLAGSHVTHGQDFDSDHLTASCGPMMGTLLSPHAADRPLPCHICFDVVRQDGARTGDPEATNTLFKRVFSDSTAKQKLGTGAVATTAVLSTADANFKALTGLLRLGRST